MKQKTIVIYGLTLLTTFGVVTFALTREEIAIFSNAAPNRANYLTIVNAGDLENGDFYTDAGTRLHFNEDGVTEGGYIEIAPLGGLYLTTPINGLSNVELNLYSGHGYEDRFTFAWCSAPYEAMDVFDGGEEARKHDFTTADCDALPPRYFSIMNPSSTNAIRINAIAIRYQCRSAFNDINDVPLLSQTVNYDDNNAIGTLEWDSGNVDLDLDKFDRGFDRKVDGHTTPGTYPVCYTVYSASSDHAFQFSHLEKYTVKDLSDGSHTVTFHTNVEYEYGDVQSATHGQNYSGPYTSGFIWDAPINNFTNITEDRHYYPVLNAFGFDPYGHCSPVSANWYLNEGHVEMPKPDHVDEGYQFVGWFIDFELTRPYNETHTSDRDIFLYAKVVKSDYPIRPIHYYEVDRHLSMIDYVVLDHTSGDSRYGEYTVTGLFDKGFYYGADDEPGYCVNNDTITITSKDEPVTIIDLYDTAVENYRQYHTEYREEETRDDEYHYVLTHFSDRAGYREEYDKLHDNVYPLPSLPFHIKDSEPYKTITSTDGYIYPYARRNTFLDDLDALTEIGPYAYACYASYSAKPLYGISGHNRVMKVGRRAFFNRFGLADHATYFPKNATIFDIEAYANVFFNNNILILPNTLQKIGARCFMGSTNVNRVYLPLSLQSVGADAFALGNFDEEMDQFVDIVNTPHIDFYYQGTEAQYHALPATTRARIEANARSITYEVDLHLHAASDYFYVFSCPYTRDLIEEE